MRCWLAVIILCALFPLYASAADIQLDSAHAERLIWEGRLGEAMDYLQPRFEAHLTAAPRYLCLTHAFAGNNEHAVYYCGIALNDSPYPLMRDCVVRERTQPGYRRQETLCYMWGEYDKLAELLALQALGHSRQGNTQQAASILSIAQDAHKPIPWLVQIVTIAMRTPPDQQIEASRILCTQLDAINEPRCGLAFAAIFPEHAKKMREDVRAEEAAAADRRRWTYIIVGAIVPLVLLAGATAYQYRARIATFLTASTTSAQTTAPGGAPTIPAYWQAWQAGYMNRAYQLAAYCWVTVWVLVCFPIVALLAIPALSILADFSAAGFQSGIARARGFAAGFLGWGRLWFGLLLLSLAGFSVFKIYGRYSLPKPFRPRIHVIRTTLRLAFLAVALLSVGTILSYFAGIAAGIYGNPVVQLLIDILRKSFGF